MFGILPGAVHSPRLLGRVHQGAAWGPVETLGSAARGPVPGSAAGCPALSVQGAWDQVRPHFHIHTIHFISPSHLRANSSYLYYQVRHLMILWFLRSSVSSSTDLKIEDKLMKIPVLQLKRPNYFALCSDRTRVERLPETENINRWWANSFYTAHCRTECILWFTVTCRTWDKAN